MHIVKNGTLSQPVLPTPRKIAILTKVNREPKSILFAHRKASVSFELKGGLFENPGKNCLCSP